MWSILNSANEGMGNFFPHFRCLLRGEWRISIKLFGVYAKNVLYQVCVFGRVIWGVDQGIGYIGLTDALIWKSSASEPLHEFKNKLYVNCLHECTSAWVITFWYTWMQFSSILILHTFEIVMCNRSLIFLNIRLHDTSFIIWKFRK